MSEHHGGCWYPMESCRCQDLREIERLKEELSNESSLRIEETQRLRRGKLPGIYHVAEIERLDDEAEKLQNHIDELEKQQDIHCGAIQSLVCEDSHVRITNKQIDAAWARKTDFSDEGLILLPADAFGIHRCEECGGDPLYPEHNDPCPDCNGHGYVVVTNNGSSEQGSDAGIKASVHPDKDGQNGTSDE